MPCVQDWPHDSGPDRSHGAAGCTITAAGFLMNDLLRQAGFLRTAFTQAEGELRSKAFFRREGVAATSAGSETTHRRCRKRAAEAASNIACLSHNPKVEND